MFSTKKRYYVQWENGIWKRWWTEKIFRRKKAATKYALRMLARNSNVAAWRVIEEDGKNLTIIFEGYINRRWRNLERKYLQNFSTDDVDKYYKPPIVNGEERRKK